MQLERRVKDVLRFMYLVFSLLGTILLVTFDFKAINLIWTVYPFCGEKMEAKHGKLHLEIKTQSVSLSVVVGSVFQMPRYRLYAFESVFVNVNVCLPGSLCIYEKAVDYIVAHCRFFDLSISHESLM